MHGQTTEIPQSLTFLAVEGVIGVGKTSLCELLGRRWNGRLILEDIDDNPFLSKFYEKGKSYSFQTETWFLLSRYRQLAGTIAQQDLFHRITISDYLLAKNRIFASINLDDDELRLYNLLVAAIEARTPRPDMVVYLQASNDCLLRRIAGRGRPFESAIGEAYIAQLNEAYNHFFFHYTESPLLVINTDEIDFVNNPGDLDELAELILRMPPGVTYYQPPRAKDRAAINGHRPPRR